MAVADCGVHRTVSPQQQQSSLTAWLVAINPPSSDMTSESDVMSETSSIRCSDNTVGQTRPRSPSPTTMDPTSKASLVDSPPAKKSKKHEPKPQRPPIKEGGWKAAKGFEAIEQRLESTRFRIAPAIGTPERYALYWTCLTKKGRMEGNVAEPVLSTTLCKTRVDDLLEGLAQARECVADGCEIWTEYATTLDAMKEELDVAQARLEKKAKTAKCGTRPWSQSGADTLAEKLNTLKTRKDSGLANSDMVVTWPPPEHFAATDSTRPTAQTMAQLECRKCKIRFALRLRFLGDQEKLTCLCAETPASKFSFAGFRNPTSPENELHNLKRVVKHYHPNVDVVTEDFQKSQRVIQLQCTVCQQQFSRAIGPRLVTCNYPCACTGAKAAPVVVAA